MLQRDVNSPETALMYMVDSTLATISSMAMKKSRGVNEYQRQISIAQSGIDWLKEYGLTTDIPSSRVEVIFRDHHGSVTDWAKKYEI